MSAMAPQITGLMVLFSTVYSEADQRKYLKVPRHWPLWGEFTGDRCMNRKNYFQHIHLIFSRLSLIDMAIMSCEFDEYLTMVSMVISSKTRAWNYREQ